jgi:hypothetical protein
LFSCLGRRSKKTTFHRPPRVLRNTHLAPGVNFRACRIVAKPRLNVIDLNLLFHAAFSGLVIPYLKIHRF